LVLGSVVVVGVLVGSTLFNAVSKEVTSTPDILSQNPEAAEFYAGCMTYSMRASGKSNDVFCTCFTEEALTRLEPTDMHIITAGYTGGGEAMSAARRVLSEVELAGYTRRLSRFNKVALPHCQNVALEAEVDTRPSM
jgi:hypothetical protein